MAAQKGDGFVFDISTCHLCNGDRNLNVNATLLTMQNCYLK